MCLSSLGGVRVGIGAIHHILRPLLKDDAVAHVVAPIRFVVLAVVHGRHDEANQVSFGEPPEL